MRNPFSRSDRRFPSILSAVISVTAIVGVSAPATSLRAASRSWDGGSLIDDNWSTPANWDLSNTLPVAKDLLTFDSSPRLTPFNDFPVDTQFNGITFGPNAGTYAISGNRILLGVQTTGVGITSSSDIVNNSVGAETINLPLILGTGRHAISTGTNTGTLSLAGTITRDPGSVVFFTKGGGDINVNGSGLSNDGSGNGGILGGWATIGGNFAAIDINGNVTPYTSYSGVNDIAGTAALPDDVTANVRLITSASQVSAALPAAVTHINSLLFTTTSASAGTETLTIGSAKTLVLGQTGGIFNTTSTLNNTSTTGTVRALTIGTNDTNRGTLTAGDGTNPASIILSSTAANDTQRTAGIVTINSVVSNNGSAPVSLIVAGGYVTLNTTNTYTGGTYILSGRISPNNLTRAFGVDPNNAAKGGPVYIFAGGQINPGGATTVNFDNDFFIAGNGTPENGGNGALRLFQNTDGNSTTISGTVTLMDSASISSNGYNANARTVGLIGKITGPGGLMIGSPTNNANASGSGIVTIGVTSGSAIVNDYAGDTTVNGSAGGAVGSTLKIGAAGDTNILPHGSTGSYALGPTGNLVLNANAATRPAILDLNGSTQTINGLTNTATSTANNFVQSNVAGGLLIAGDSNATSSFGGILRNGNGSLALTKMGNGSLTLSGANTYTGATQVNGGKLVVGDGVSGSLSGTASVTVSATGTLSGSGTITTGSNGNVTLASGAFLEPGAATGNLTLTLGTGQLDISGAATPNSAGAFKFDLDAPGASDKVTLSSGSLQIGTGALEFNDFAFNTLGGFTGGTYLLFDGATPISGTLGASLSGLVGGLSSNLQLADGGNDLVLVVVPEPSAALLMCAGMASLLLRRRQNRSGSLPRIPR